MPRRSSTQSSVAPIETTAVPVEIVKTEVLPQPRAPKEVILSPADVPPVKKTSSKKKKVVAAPAEPVPEPVVVPEPPVDLVTENLEEDVNLEEVPTVPVEDDAVVDGDKSAKRARRVVNKDTLRQDWDLLWTEYAEELSAKKKPGKKLSLGKYLLRLQGDVYKLMKLRPLGEEKKPRSENNNSGFMKPVHISPELAQFINVNASEPITRVLITKKICEYIKEKDLQNPTDRREILPDLSLKKIFKLNETEPEPLTYYSMQKKIQSHIFKA